MRLVSTVGEVDNVPLCEDCGACCMGGGERYVRVTGNDHARMGPLANRWTTFVGNRCYMNMHDGRCAALRRERATGRLLCGIYSVRPQVCRDLERGSPACAAERDRKQAAAERYRQGSLEIE